MHGNISDKDIMAMISVEAFATMRYLIKLVQQESLERYGIQHVEINDIDHNIPL